MSAPERIPDALPQSGTNQSKVVDGPLPPCSGAFNRTRERREPSLKKFSLFASEKKPFPTRFAFRPSPGNARPWKKVWKRKSARRKEPFLKRFFLLAPELPHFPHFAFRPSPENARPWKKVWKRKSARRKEPFLKRFFLLAPESKFRDKFTRFSLPNYSPTLFPPSLPWRQCRRRPIPELFRDNPADQDRPYWRHHAAAEDS